MKRMLVFNSAKRQYLFEKSCTILSRNKSKIFFFFLFQNNCQLKNKVYTNKIKYI